MILFHRTTHEAATAILAGSFKDSVVSFDTDRSWSGAWFPDDPVDEYKGAHGPVLLKVTLDASDAELARNAVPPCAGLGHARVLLGARIVT